MAKQKSSLNEITTTTIVVGDEKEQNTAQDSTELKATLAEIRKYAGVLGYILKDAATAIVDIQEPSQLIQYAMLASEAFDANVELSVLFELGDMKTAIIECPNLKVLCAIIGECTVNIFMEKDTDHSEIMRKLLLHPE
jgi:hypothetical protein